MSEGAAPAWTHSDQVLPVGRVQWLLDNQYRTDRLVVRGVFMWLDCRWSNANTTTEFDMPDIEMYVVKTTSDVVNVEAVEYAPFSNPATPAAYTSWNTGGFASGMDPFLWRHFLRGLSPPNAIIRKTTNDVTTSSEGAWNQTTRITNVGASEVAPATVCRTFRVAAEWQPDVRIKAARRMMRGDGLILGIRTATSGNSGVTFQCNARFLVLAS